MIRRLLSTVGVYGLSTLLTFVVGILSVPALTLLVGPTLWTGIVIAQSIAAIAAVVVAFGWSATGPTMIASLPPSDRPEYFWRSFQARIPLFIVAAPVAILIAMLTTPLSTLAAALAVCAYLGQALGGVWFYVGESRPFRVLLLDTLPRTGSIVVGLGFLTVTHSLEVYLSCLVGGTLITVIAALVTILRHEPRSFIRPAGLLRTLKDQRHAVITTSAAAMYSNSPLLIATILAPSGLEAFAYAFKVYNYAAAAFVPLVQVAQGWVPAAGWAATAQRARRVVMLGSALSAFCGLAMAVLLPAVAAILSAGTIEVPYELAIPFGLTTAAILLNQLVGLACLTSLRRTAALAASVSLGAVVGLALMLAFTPAWGSVGLSAALSITEWLVTIYQLGSLRRAVNESSGPSKAFKKTPAS